VQNSLGGINALNSTSSNLPSLSPPAFSTASLEASLPATCTAGYSSDLCSEVNSYALSAGLLSSPHSSQPASLAAAAAAAAVMEAGSLDLALQQLQQQNIMLLQPMGNPLEDDRHSAERVLLSNTTQGFVEDRSRQLLQLSCSSASDVQQLFCGACSQHGQQPHGPGSTATLRPGV